MPHNTPAITSPSKSRPKPKSIKSINRDTALAKPQKTPQLTAEEEELIAKITKVLKDIHEYRDSIESKTSSSQRTQRSKHSQRGGNMQGEMNVGDLLQARDPMLAGSDQGMKSVLTTPFGAGGATSEPISGENTLLPNLYSTAPTTGGGKKRAAKKKTGKSVKAK